ncbi:MAG: penicillin acylase family protein [Alphaproteobacteria bacterium]|nr:penicillin acylase family protein [Alphaproteobacteria bacterium]
MAVWKWVLGGVAAVAVIGAGGAAAYLWTPTGPAFDADAARTAAAAYDARVIRDRYGVPHIYGPRNADVAFGLAYAHAEDDWTNIEQTFLASRGVLAQRDGEAGAVLDYVSHVLGAIESVEAGYETKVSAQARAVAEGYAAGINLWCSENPTSGCAGVAPVRGQDVIRNYAARPPAFYGIDGALGEILRGEGEIELSVRTAFRDYHHTRDGFEFGSNAVAVGPARSADGHTRLLVNAHQPFAGPVAWYEARLKSEEGIDLIGGIFPGSALMLHGVGPNIGWAATVNHPDLTDIFLLTVDDPDKPRRYKLDGEWRDFEVKTARMRVKLWGPFSLPVTRELLVSAHGPAFVTKRGVLALSFVGNGDLGHLDQYLGMNMATSLDEWRTAMKINAIPSVNYVAADSAGNIGFFYNAHMPTRAAGWDRTKILPGDISETLWTGFEPLDRMPHVVNPTSGYVVSANQTPFFTSGPEDNPAREAFPESYGLDTLVTNRSRRGQALFGGDPSITREEFIAYKMDDAYHPDSNLMKLIAELTARGAGEDAELRPPLEVLAGWNGRTTRDNRGAALAVHWGQKAMGSQMHDATTAEKAIPLLKESAAEIKAVYGRLDPEWQEFYRLDRGEHSLPIDGGPDVLRAIYASGDIVAKGHRSAVVGDSYVAVADWAPDGAVRISTIHEFGTATLDAASPHYGDQAQMFARGEFKEPAMSLEAVTAEATRDYRPGRAAGETAPGAP